MNEYDFIAESNKIEGIHRKPTKEEINEFYRFMDLNIVTVEDMQQFVKVYQPNAELRTRVGLDVFVGNHMPPKGGANILVHLDEILYNIPRDNSYKTHIAYEKLHPFTDCNGRSGRMLWAWQVKDISLGFLHRFYYQALKEAL